MQRQDLLALSEDDLVLLTNRGTVKRCIRELAENEFSFKFEDDLHGNLKFFWSDGADCSLPANASLSSSVCSCPALGICRHLVRSVLTYQRLGTTHSPADEHASSSSASASPSIAAPEAGAQATPSEIPATDAGKIESVPAEHSADGSQTTPPAQQNVNPSLAGTSWNPGDITDEVMNNQMKPAIVKRARKLFNESQVVELIIGPKPLARYFTIPAAVRFLVPGDARYTHCNCVEEAPCVHVALSILAFRLLKQRSAAIVTTGDTKVAPPLVMIEEIELLLKEITCVGLAGLTHSYVSRLQKLKQKCEQSGLSWTSDLIQDALEERDRYHAGDALFSQERLVEVIGEICARNDALKNETGAVPRIFVTGSSADRPADQDNLRLIGLGCGVEHRNRSASLTAYFQDDDTGYLIGIRRQVVTEDDTADQIRRFWQFAAGTQIRNHNLHSLAAGQLLCKGGKLTPSRLYSPGRVSPLALNPQSFNWEKLKFPILVESFSDLRSLIAFQPPAYLGPRHPGRNFHVCPINRMESVRFSTSHQALVGTAIDKAGDRATFYHPYTLRGRDGLEATMRILKDPKVQPIFVAGMFSARASGLVVRPVSIVVQDGAMRKILQPWIDALPQKSSSEQTPEQTAQQEASVHPLQAFADALEGSLGELLIDGVERTGDHTVKKWQQLAAECNSLGFVELSRAVTSLYKSLENRRHNINWMPAEAATLALKLCVLQLVAREIIFDVLTPTN